MAWPCFCWPESMLYRRWVVNTCSTICMQGDMNLDWMKCAWVWVRTRARARVCLCVCVCVQLSTSPGLHASPDAIPAPPPLPSPGTAHTTCTTLTLSPCMHTDHPPGRPHPSTCILLLHMHGVSTQQEHTCMGCHPLCRALTRCCAASPPHLMHSLTAWRRHARTGEGWPPCAQGL